MVRVTIGLPFHNNGDTLTDAIRSVFAQTFTDWELILMDDGSDDSSRAVAECVADPRVTLVKDRERKGLAHRLNQISSLARGEYVARMDADDLMHPERIAEEVKFLDCHPHIDLVGCWAYTLDAGSRLLGIRTANVGSRPEAVLVRRPFIHPTVLGRTIWFRQNSYDPSFSRSQDHELWCRTCRTSSFGSIPECLYFYREGRSNVRKYLMNMAADRRVLRMYGPSYVGHMVTTALIGESYLKGCAYQAFSALNAENAWTGRRNLPLDEADRLQALRWLEVIRRTPVPGFEGAQGDGVL